MDTSKLKLFSPFARRCLIQQVSDRLNLVLSNTTSSLHHNSDSVKQLKTLIQENGKPYVIEYVAYMWFNRFCALRFMDVKRYAAIRIVSPAVGQFLPEILTNATLEYIDPTLVPLANLRSHIVSLLNGTLPSPDPYSEAYRLLLLASCNYWHNSMPFLFQPPNNYTELLLPNNLLDGSSILSYTRESLTPDVCKDVEVVNWLYHYYFLQITDKMFKELKKNMNCIIKYMQCIIQYKSDPKR